MRKRIFMLMSILVLSVFGFSSFAFAAVPATSGLSKQIVDKANKGDAAAIQAIDAYSQSILDAAQNGDPVAQEQLRNLQCFDDQKVSEVVAKVKLKPGETFKYYFSDGSAISFSNNSPAKKGEVSALGVIYATKGWWFGPCYASLRTYVDTTGSTRTTAHIADAWGDISSLGCTMSEPTITIVKNDAPLGRVRDASVVTLPAGAGTKSVWAIYDVDPIGLLVLVSSY